MMGKKNIHSDRAPIRPSRRRQYALAALALLCLVPGCKSMHPVENLDNREQLVEQVKVGRTVRITTKNNETIYATVTAITPDRISVATEGPNLGDLTTPGRTVDVPIDDVSKLEVKKFSHKKTRKTVVFGSITAGAVVSVVVLVVALSFLLGV